MIRSAGVALVAALALAPAARARAAAGEAAPPLATDAVDVTVAGTPDDLEHVRGLAVARALGARVRWLHVERVDPASVLAVGAGDAAVRVWVDMTDARHARLYFATRLERFLVRDVELSGRFDEVDRAALAEVLELSVGALMENERAGMTRDEAQALLARGTPPLHAAPAPESTPPLPPPPPLMIPSRWGAGAFYGAQAPTEGDSPIAHGPGLLLTLAHNPYGQHRGRGLLFWASGQWNTLDAAAGLAPIGVALDTIAARAGIELGDHVGLGLRFGAGVDFVHIAPRGPAPGPVVALAPARWSSDLIVSAAVRSNLAVIGQARITGLFVLDFAPTSVSYDVAAEGTRSTVFSPGRFRPGVAFELTVHRTFPAPDAGPSSHQ